MTTDSNNLPNPGSGRLIDGDEAANQLIGTPGPDIINGRGGGDQLIGNGGNDLLNGGDGGDQVIGGSGDDTLDGGTGDDQLIAGAGDDELTGGLGNDNIVGGTGTDTARFDDVDVPVTIAADPQNANRILATREVGFDLSVANQPFDSESMALSGEQLLSEAIGGNLYFNVHTTEFAGGEIRGQLIVEFDRAVDGVRTIVLSANLDSAQEPGNASDSAATGEGRITITADGHAITYDAALSVAGIAPGELLPVAGFSAIHLHNAPAGVNGPVVIDVIADAGGTSAIVADVEQDEISGIEQVIFSDDGGDINVDGIVEVAVGDNEGETNVPDENGNDFNVINGDGDDNNLVGTPQNDQINGLDGDDTLAGLAGDDELNGGRGDDVLIGGSGADALNGDAGQDTADFSGSDAGVTIDLAARQADGGDATGDVLRGIDGLTGSGFDDVLRGFDNQGTNPDDTFTNIFSGGAGNDLLDGRGGDDILAGNSGNDTLIGGAGDDVLRGGGGTDVIDGGEGTDTNDFSDINASASDPAIAGVTVTVAADGSGTASYIAGGVDGNPVINETFTGIENIVGTVNDDSITATGAAPNTIDGGAGNDFIAGGGGVDVLDGGEGVDTNSFVNIGAEVIADLGSGSASYAPNENVTVFENFRGFENLDGSANDDQLFGDGGANTLTGNAGNDLLVGRGGDDVLKGGLGDDVLRGGGGSDITNGGEGIDTADFSDIGVSVNVDLEAGSGVYNVNGNTVTDTLIDIENLTGSANDDVLSGDSGDNLIAGGAGADTLNGGAGSDVLRGDAVGDGEAITVSVTNTLSAGGTFLTPVWFGFHDGQNFDLLNVGEAASLGLERIAEDGSIEGIAAEFNQQVGNGGVDATIVGGAGAPGPIDPGETASFTLNVNPDQVGEGFFTWATMVIPSNDSFLASPDNPLSDAIFDENGDFIGPLVIERFGSDVLDAGTEVNNEEGAAFLNQTARDQGEREDGVVQAAIGFNGSEGNPDGQSRNILGGTTAAGTQVDPVVGDFSRNNGNEQLLRIVVDRVQGSDDVLNGGAGNDRLEGGGGRDTFVVERGTGADTVLDFAVDADTGDLLDVSDFGFSNLEEIQSAAVQDGQNTVISFGNGDQVTLENIDLGDLVTENFVFADAPIVPPVDPNPNEVFVDNRNDDNDVIGTEGDDLIDTGNNQDVVAGLGGNDVINSGNGDDDVNGGTGNDTIIGSRGDDNLEGFDGNDILVGGRGDDNLEGGDGNDLLEGGRGNDVMNGGDGDDLICGFNGDDALNGGRGNDRLEGGRGSDTFIFEAMAGNDVITDFAGTEDILDLSSADFDFESVDDVLEAASGDDGNLVIDLGDGGQVTLLGVSITDLNEDNVSV